MKRETSSGGGTPGGSTLMVIFAVLCISVFAILSLSGSLAGGRMSDASADAVSSYYMADVNAEEILADIRSGEIPQGVNKSGDIYSYRCPMTDTTAIDVQVKVQGDEYEILRWQQVYTAEWKNNENLGVWDGETTD